MGTTIDRSWFAVRTEVHCARGGGHSGARVPRSSASDQEALLHEWGGDEVRAEAISGDPARIQITALAGRAAQCSSALARLCRRRV